MEPTLSPIHIVIIAISSILYVLVLIGLNTVMLMRFLKRPESGEQPEAADTLAIAAWLTALITLWTGPCALPGQILALILAGVALIRVRSGAASERSRIPAIAALLTAILTLLWVVPVAIGVLFITSA